MSKLIPVQLQIAKALSLYLNIMFWDQVLGQRPLTHIISGENLHHKPTKTYPLPSD